MVAPGGVCGCSQRGCAWLLPGGGRAWDMTRYGDTITERAVRILLEGSLFDLCVKDVNGEGEDTSTLPGRGKF